MDFYGNFPIFNGKVVMTSTCGCSAGPLMAVKQLALLVHPDKTQHPRAVELGQGAGAEGLLGMEKNLATAKNAFIKWHWYTIWLFNIAMENPFYMEVLMGKSSINGPFSMAMLNNQMVHGFLLGKFYQWDFGAPFWKGRPIWRIDMLVLGADSEGTGQISS